jgi:hypothetical protein
MPDSPWRTPIVAPNMGKRRAGKSLYRRPSLIERAARVAFTFLVMNYSAVAGLVAALRGKEVRWR